ncbi:MAG: RnfABCDGE type electron transport complex subunit B, partial [Lachnospiraceae bacterium]|nr:RnfABCDGE type electron transport complex subunit B [Lachnospiraceae bacterium]
MELLIPAAVVGGLGLFLGVFLGVVSEKLKVDVDPREDQVREALPGANCGGCGYPGCDALASAIVRGEAPCNACPVGGRAVAEKISAIMGEEVKTGVRQVAYVKCAGVCGVANRAYAYTGVMDCNIASCMPNSGDKTCTYGCLGYGSCVKACPFDAIHIVNGIAKVDPERCKACGKCVAACPRHLIEMVPENAKVLVACNSRAVGMQAKKACGAACIGCGACEKQCPFGAITVVDHVAHIDQSLCKSCGKCIMKCPTGAITAPESILARVEKMKAQEAARLAKEKEKKAEEAKLAKEQKALEEAAKK